MLAGLIAFFLVVIVALFSTALQARARDWFRAGPRRVFLVPAALTALFAAVLWRAGGFSLPFLALIAAYTLAPAALVALHPPGEERPRWTDFAAILLIWLPLEFAAGFRPWLPERAWGMANLTARGVSIVLALSLFLLYRGLKGMKYNLPRRWRDLLYPAVGFAVALPVLMALGMKLGFIGPFRGWEVFHAGGFLLLWAKTLAGVALPEELLFRALIQNWLMQRFGFHYATLLAAALIFGASHLDNGPGPLPNWRYMVLATIAGFIFGKVFWKSSTILSSAGLHALVNSVRHALFA
jgi:membrane protease YdiL (CAAX protease family)